MLSILYIIARDFKWLAYEKWPFVEVYYMYIPGCNE